MLIRSAYWLGAAKPGADASFREKMGEVIAIMRGFPGVSEVRALWPITREDDPPEIFCQVVVAFEGQGGREQMMASDERKAARSHVLELVGMFDGRLSHIEFEVL